MAFVKWIAGYIFRIYDYKVFLAGAVLWLILVLIPDGFFLDNLNLRKAIENGTFTRILLSFISVFGFLITVLILTYGFLREKFRRLALKEFLENKYSNLLISLFIVTFLLNIFSAIYLDSHPVTHTSLNLAYYSLYLSVLYIAIFLPIAFISIAQADSQSIFGKYLTDLKTEHFPKYPYNELTITHDEKNPIVVLTNLCRGLIDKDDFHSINAILFSSQKRIEELIGFSNDREMIGSLLTGQKMIWDSIVPKVLQKKEYVVINNLLLAHSFYHHHFSEKKIPLLYLEELSFFMKALVERLVKEDAADAVEQALLSYEKIIAHHYDNSVPPQEKIRDLKFMLKEEEKNVTKDFKLSSQDESININLQWHVINSDLPYIFSIILSKSIEEKNHVLFERAIMSIPSLVDQAHRSKMGDLQKAFIIRHLAGTLHYYQIEALKNGIIKETIRIRTMLDSFTLTTMIDEGKEYKKYVLESSAEFLIDLFKHKKLDAYQINFIGSIGRHCVNKYQDSESQKETFAYILRIAKYFKAAFENDLDANAKNYVALREAVESFIEFHKMESLTTWKPGQSREKKETDKSLLDEISNFLKEFQNVSVQELPSTIPWKEDQTK
jgi:hypothetical protein